MSHRSTLWLAFVASLGLAVLAGAAPARSAPLSELEARFVCPEALPNDAARNHALHAFFDAFAQAAPTARLSDMLLYRRVLLARHGCRQTLRSLEAADQAVDSGKDVQVQAWLPIAGAGGVTLEVSTDHLRLYLDPSATAEKTVIAYARVRFAEPRQTSATEVRYDTVVSHAIYYCASGRYALVENDYFLGDREVLAEPSPSAVRAGVHVYASVATPAGSLNAAVQQWACGSMTGVAA